MDTLEKVKPGQPVTASLFNRLVDAIRACRVTSVAGGRVTHNNTGGTTIGIDRPRNPMQRVRGDADAEEPDSKSVETTDGKGREVTLYGFKEAKPGDIEFDDLSNHAFLVRDGGAPPTLDYKKIKTDFEEIEVVTDVVFDSGGYLNLKKKKVTVIKADADPTDSEILRFEKKSVVDKVEYESGYLRYTTVSMFAVKPEADNGTTEIVKFEQKSFVQNVTYSSGKLQQQKESAYVVTATGGGTSDIVTFQECEVYNG